MDIVNATPNDIPDILAIMDEALRAAPHKDWYMTDDAQFIERHMGSEGYTLKCVDGDRVAAFLIVRYPKDAKDNLGLYFPELTMQKLEEIAHMESISVRREYRGKGLQKKLLLAAEAIERKKGTQCLMATVHPDNCFSLNNFLSVGYECLLETRKYGGVRRKVIYKDIN